MTDCEVDAKETLFLTQVGFWLLCLSQQQKTNEYTCVNYWYSKVTASWLWTWVLPFDSVPWNCLLRQFRWKGLSPMPSLGGNSSPSWLFPVWCALACEAELLLLFSAADKVPMSDLSCCPDKIANKSALGRGYFGPQFKSTVINGWKVVVAGP